MSTTPLKSCRTCKHSDMDMDMEPYCAHPAVCTGSHPDGLNLSSRNAPTRDDGACTQARKLWEVRT